MGVSKAKIARDLKVSRMTVYRALEMVAAPTEPGKSPSITVTLHLTIGNFNKRGRGRKPALEHIEAMLKRDYAMAPLGRCDYQLTIPYRAEPDDSDLDAEVNHLQVEMLNIAEGYRCSIETDIREVGGAERVW